MNPNLCFSILKGAVAPTIQHAYDTNAQVYFDKVAALGGSFDYTAIGSSYTVDVVKQAISDFYAGLKSDGLYSLIGEAWMFYGKTAAAHTVPMKTPANTGSFGGTVTHGLYGVQGDGSTGYFDCGYNPSTAGWCTVGSSPSISMSSFIRTSRTSSVDAASVCWSTTYANDYILSAKNVRGKASGGLGGTTGLEVAITNAAGYLIASRTSVTSLVLYKAGASLGSYTTSVTPGSATPHLFLLAGKRSDRSEYFTSDVTGFAHFGFGLTAAQAALLNARVTTLMTATGRPALA